MVLNVKVKFVVSILRQVLGPMAEVRPGEKPYRVGTKLDKSWIIVYPGFVEGPNRAIAYNVKTEKIDIAT